MALTEILNGRSGKRDVAYGACGMLLGVMAPIGWITLRLILFWDDSQSLASQVMQDIMGTEQSRYMYSYMCGGTMVVLGLFGFFFGRASQQIHDRALKLETLNREVAEQKASFEQSFTDLDLSITSTLSMLICKKVSIFRKLTAFRLRFYSKSSALIELMS